MNKGMVRGRQGLSILKEPSCIPLKISARGLSPYPFAVVLRENPLQGGVLQRKGSLMWRLLAQFAILLLSMNHASAQWQLDKLVPPSATPDAWYASAIATDASLAAVSALGQGNVYVYEKNGDAWSLAQTLSVDTGFFGTPLSLSGEWLAIGSKTDSPLGSWLAGSVSMYRREADVWVFKTKLIASDNQSLALFGGSVSMVGDTLVVGAANYSLPPSGYRNGAAYVFSLQGTNWLQTGKLTASDPTDDSMFGYSVAIDGSQLAVGALHQYSPTVGSVYLFENTSGQWAQTAQLFAGDGNVGDYFGYALALQSGLLVVGAPKHATGTCCPDGGSAYVFRKGNVGWVEEQELHASDPSNGEFGSSVALSWPELVVGCPHDNDYGLAGSAYYYHDSELGWAQQGKLLPNSVSKPIPGGSNWGMGTSVALGRGWLLCGAPNDTSAIAPGGVAETGAMYVFQLPMSSSQYCSCPVQGSCANPDSHGGCYNSTGQGSVLQACGSGSVTIDDIRMESRWMPPNVPGIVIMGPRPDETPYGDGILCVGPGNKGVFRFRGGNSGPDGVIKLGPGIVAYSHANFPTTGHIQPGDTWYFQAWYRDPNGPCGSGFNLSNGLKVEFTQ